MRNRGLAVALALVLTGIGSTAAAQWKVPPPAPAPNFAAAWKQVDRLAHQERYEAAAAEVQKIRERARQAGNEDNWTKALVREVRYRSALGAHETAVRLLKDQPWPKERLSRAVLQLYYAEALVAYYGFHGWEIGKRERVSGAPTDLRAWTSDQIHGAAISAYADVWKDREALGGKPVAKFAGYLEANNYPAEVRGTLRDAVSYLFVDLLANTQGWRPEESSESDALDFRALLAGDAAKSGHIKLDDPAVHPLLKIGAVLDDLERWHQGRGDREAALEARLTRARTLFALFDDAARRDQLINDLTTRLAAFKDRPWWAMGQAEVAALVRQRGGPDALVKARALADAGARAYPVSLGGKRCQAIVAGIEAPTYSLESMKADGLGRRSLLVTHKNLAALHFRAYPVDLERQVTASREYDLLPDARAIKRKLGGSPAAAWTVALPATPDFRQHYTYVTPPIDKPGLYSIVASRRKDFAEAKNTIVGARFIATRLVVVTQQSHGTDGATHEARVLEGDTGKPAAGVEVRLYRVNYGKESTMVATRKTDANGLARFAPRSDRHFVLAKRGRDYALDENAFYLGADDTSRSRETTDAFVYTDRSIYRPLQKLFFKAVVFRGRAAAARFNVVAGQSVTVTLRDANYQEVDKRTLTTNAYGSVAGEFTLPAGRLLGAWSVVTSVGGRAGVQVEEYKRPTFEVKLDDPKSVLRLGKPGDLTGNARTYFGLPVIGGQLRWRVAREPVYPYWWGWFWSRSGAEAREETVASGSVPLDAAGAFHFSFVPRAPTGASTRGQHADAITYNYRVTAEITAEGGETRSAERTFRLGLTSVEARLTGNGFLREGVAAEVTATRTDLDGVPRGGNARWRLVALAQPKAPVLASERAAPPAGPDAGFETPGDRLRPRWEKQPSPEQVMRDWADSAEKAAGALVHDAKGRATIALPALPAGAYRIRYETQDEFGARYRTQQDIIVAGARTPLALPSVLLVEQSTVNVGKSARLLAAGGFADQTLFVETWRAGKKVAQRILVAGRDAAVIEIPIKEEDRGGLSVTLTALRDHQLMTASIRLTVPWDDRQLDVKLSSFRDKLRPGGKETWKVTVKGPAAAKPEAAAAELLAYMYDRTLDALATHAPPTPMSLWPDRSVSPIVQGSLGQSYGFSISSQRERSTVPGLRGDRLALDRRTYGYGRAYGIGGLAGVVGRLRLSEEVVDGLEDNDGCPDGGCAEAQAFGVDLPATEKPREGWAKREGSDKNFHANLALLPGDSLRARRGPAPPLAVRANFAETAFWKPQLLTGADGSASIEFTVPESVTSWNVGVHALTKDLASGSVMKQVESLKELMVRPSVPRFLREGDRAELQVMVNNAGERELAGELRLAVSDPATGRDMAAAFGLAPRDLARPFKVAKGGGAQVTFPLAAPREVGLASFTVTAAAGDLSDGERRPLPVLPSRVHLVQSKFVTLKDRDRREMTFPDMSAADSTRVNDQLVVTVDAQLFNTVLRALPYLRRYPYECTEQTLNRFVSAGIVTSAFRQYPAIGNLAKQASARTTPLEPFDAADANRKMALEETPWLVEAKGAPPRADEKEEIVDILNPTVAAAEREAALAKLTKAQTSTGGFPWFPGGPPDPYMTLYIMEGFARAAEFKVPVPKDVVQRGWQYLARHYRSDYMGHLRKGDCCWEWLTFLNFVAGSYPDPSWVDGTLSADERREILDFSFRRWKKHPPYLKGLLALSLHRAGRSKDARLVWASVMDAAKSRPDEGTFFAPEERSWLWYEDTIETHAFALRTLMELDPRSDKKDGLVLWLLLQKKLGQWKSTRATAEVIYALVHYLKKEGTLGTRENARVTIAGKTTEMVFEPGALTGNKNQIVVPGHGLSKDSAQIGVAKDAKGFALASAAWHFSTEKLPQQEHGDFFSVSRRYFRRDGAGKQVTLSPLAEGSPLRPGDELEVQLSLRSKHAAEYIHLRDPRGAGFEPSVGTSGHRYDLGVSWYEEIRDSGVNFFFDRLPAGEYTFKYRVRATMAGTFRVGPATVQSLYAPEFNAYSAGTVLTVAAGK